MKPGKVNSTVRILFSFGIQNDSRNPEDRGDRLFYSDISKKKTQHKTTEIKVN